MNMILMTDDDVEWKDNEKKSTATTDEHSSGGAEFLVLRNNLR